MNLSRHTLKRNSQLFSQVATIFFNFGQIHNVRNILINQIKLLHVLYL